MKRQVLKLTCAAIMLTWAASIAAADVKIKTKNTTGALSFQSTTWIKGARLRTAQGIGLDSVDQCDLNRTVMINEKGKLYMVQSKSGQSPESQLQSIDPSQQMPKNLLKPPEKKHEGKHGVTTYTTTIVDTGERKESFGFKARHLRLTTVAESSSDACNPVKMKMESDGWYIDLDIAASCNQPGSTEPASQASKSDCGDEVFIQDGRRRQARLSSPANRYHHKWRRKAPDDDYRSRRVVPTDA